jgi:uncharacterized protein YwgA
MHQDRKPESRKAADLVSDAGGRLVGRTRLQKIAYLLEVTGLGDGFSFHYRHYGPYSEELTRAVRSADLLGLISEEEHSASWGGSYSVFTSHTQSSRQSSKARKQLIAALIDADSVALELAATAVLLHGEGLQSAWAETARRKPEKADGDRLDKARLLYNALRQIHTPHRLPELE